MTDPLPPDGFSRHLAPGTLRRVFGGFVLGALIGSATVTMMLASADMVALPPLEVVPKGVAILGLVTLTLTAFIALPLTFVPAVLFIVWSEYRGERRPIAHILAGVGSSAWVWAVFALQARGAELVADPRFIVALLTAGLTAGLAYWVLAGRYAGLWRLRVPGVL